MRPALIAVGFAVSAAFAYVAVRKARFDDVWAALVDSDYVWLAPALAALAAWFVIRVERWRSLFAADRRPGMEATASALYVGYFFNSILPARAGEAARVLALSQRSRTSLAETTATVVVERVFDVLSLLLLLFVMLPWLPDLAWVRAAAVFGAAVALALTGAVVAIAVYGERPFTFLFRQLARLPLVSEERIRHSPTNVIHGLLGVRDARTGAVAFAWTTLSWLAMGCCSWFVMLAFDLGLSPLAGELVVIGIGLALILPSSPAGVGVVEGATVIVLGAYGVADSPALSYALVLHAVNVIPFLVLAPFVLRPYGALLRRGEGQKAAAARARI